MEKEMIMTTHEIAKMVAEACKGETDKRLTIEDAKVVLRLAAGAIADAIVEGKVVRLHGFCDLFGQVVEAGEAIDPRTGTTINVPRRMLAKAKLSRSYKQGIKDAYAAKIANA